MLRSIPIQAPRGWGILFANRWGIQITISTNPNKRFFLRAERPEGEARSPIYKYILYI
jgi:hypothetical protein